LGFGLAINAFGLYGLVAGVLKGALLFRKDNFTGAPARIITIMLILFGIFTFPH
jgi:hypothetical protein